ncbi:cytochrome c oxidase assembly protein [Herbidospora sp. NBRC 101105]|uniref:cytochrome c oxidase assembly protein n=1 Tax=Herbidospora sp. NBRC 101105 TaxID=3032195 RepID=UPI0024A139F9|nr:cytochrome c oxidase assembly protein [Herbidospora sp. NBRC 101105]GLX96597.1 copper resistance protein D [Herbidospora sp. NBRC 101105]
MRFPPRAQVAVTVVAAVTVLFAVLWYGGGRPAALVEGLPSPGLLTEWGLPFVRLLHDVCGVATVGLLLTSVAFTRDEAIRTAARRQVVWWASGWALTALATIALTLSDFLGLPVHEALGAGVLQTFVLYIPQGQAFLLVAMIALVIAVCAMLRGAEPVLLGAAVFAALPPAYVGHSASAADHNLAVSSLMLHIAAAAIWVGGLYGVLTMVRRDRDMVWGVRRFSAVALCAYAAVGASGLINAWVRLGGLTTLFESRYGLLVLAKIAALALLGWFGWRHRKVTIARLEAGTAEGRSSRDESVEGQAAGEQEGSLAAGSAQREAVAGQAGDGAEASELSVAAVEARRPFLRLAAVEVAIMTATMALAVGLSRTAPPATTDVPNVNAALGYVLPPISFDRLLSESRLDPIILLGIAGLVIAYLAGVHRQVWPVGRTVAWFAGILVLLYASTGGLAAYGSAVFSVVSVEYALLGTLAPALLAYGAPLGLAGRREVLPRFLANPAVALALYVASPVFLYVLGFFELAQSSHALHLAMVVVQVTAGLVFFVVVAGVDPLPRAVHTYTRIQLVGIAIAVQLAVGVLLLLGPLQAQDWYALVAVDWVPDRAGDQRLGALLGAGITLAVLLAVLVSLLVQVVAARRRVSILNVQKMDDRRQKK